MSSFLSQIIVSNKSNVPRAEILAIVGADHVLTKNESMQEWVKSGEDKDSWDRFTSILKVTDKTVSELSYLLEPLINNATANEEVLNNRKWYFIEPDKDSFFYNELYLNGEVTASFSDVDKYLLERI